MKNLFLIIFLILVSSVNAGHVYNWNSQIFYGPNGNPSWIHLHYKLETTLPTNQYIHVIFPFDPNPSKAYVQEFQDDQSRVESVMTNIPTANQCIFQFDKEFQKDVWYTLQVEVTNTITAQFYISPVQIFTKSQVTLPGQLGTAITYDENLAFTQINILKVPQYTNLRIQAQYESSDSTQIQGFQQQNFVLFDITPSIDTPNGAIFYIHIQDESFTFSSTCTSVKGSDIDALDQKFYNCDIDQENKNRVIVELNQDIQKDVTFRIKALVSNPQKVKQSGFKVYYYEKKGSQAIGQIIELNEENSSVFKTSSIDIQQEDFKVLWGFKHTDSYTQVLKSMFLSAPGDNHYVYNNIEFGFSIQKNPPSDGQNFYYKLIIKVQHDLILDGSIRHNLPSAVGRNIVCSSIKTAGPVEHIECNFMGTLQVQTQYYVAAKVVFNAIPTDTADFGMISIVGVEVQDNGSLQDDTSIFNTQREQITLSAAYYIQSTSYVATDGTAGFQKKLGNTQVISVPDSYSKSVEDVWGDIDQSTFGIRNVQDQQQAFVLFLEADATKTCGSFTECSNDPHQKSRQVKMEIFFNHNAIEFDEEESQSGIQLGAYDTDGVKDGATCSKGGTPQCVDYERGQISQMREEFYNFKELISDTNSDKPKYGKYSFYCGDNAQDTTTNPTLASQCVFDGKISTTDNENAILMMRNAKLSQQFKFDNFYAKNEQQLDFIVAFYSGQMDCEGDPCKHSNTFQLASASVIHGYSISDSSGDSDQWDGLYYNFVNYWQVNDGSKIPTYFRIHKEFHSSKIVDHNAVGVFFDNSVDMSFTKDYDNEHSYYCTSVSNGVVSNECELVKGTTLEQTGNWRNSQGVIFKETEIVENENIEILIPVETLSQDPIYLTIVLFNYNSNSNSQKVYETKAVYNVKGTTDLGTDITSFQDNTDANIGVAIARNGVNLVPKTFKYGVEEYDIPTKTLKFTPSITGETESDIDFSSNPNAGSIDNSGSGITITAQKVDIFSDSLNLNLDNSGRFRCFKVQLGDEYYSLFCPFNDNPLTLLQQGQSDVGLDVVVQSGFPIAFHVDDIFVYGFSGVTGKGEVVFQQSKSIAPGAVPSCTLYQVSQVINKNDAKPQQFLVNIAIDNAIPIDPDAKAGTKYVEVEITFVPGSSQLHLTTFCETGVVGLTCVLDIGGAPVILAKLTVDSDIQISQLYEVRLTLELLPQKTLDDSLTFTASIKMGNSDATNTAWIWGDRLHPTKIIEWNNCNTGGTMDGSGTAPVENNFFLDTQVQFEGKQKTNPSLFFIKFGPGSGRSKIDEGDFIEFQLGWVNEGQTSGISGCKVLEEQTGQISYDWNRIDLGALPILKIYAGKDIEILDPVQKYILLCEGLVPSPVGVVAVEAKWVDNTIDIQTTTTQIAVDSTLENSPAALTVTLDKFFQTPGNDGDYIFTITPGELLYQKSRIFVQFTGLLSPRLNSKEGKVYCVIDDIHCICKMVANRRLEVTMPKQIDIQFDLKVNGITLHAYDAGYAAQNIWVGISVNGPYDEITKASQVAELELAQTVEEFSIISASILPAQVRSKVTHIIEADFPMGQIIKDQVFYLDFFQTPYSSLWAPICRVERIGDQQSQNWVKSCQFINDFRLKFVIRQTDIQSTTRVQRYKIEVINGPSPYSYEDKSAQNLLQYKILFTTPTTDDFIVHQSVYTSQLAEVQFEPADELKNLNFEYKFVDDTIQESLEDQLVVYKGYYSTKVELYSMNLEHQKDLFNSEFPVAITGQNGQFIHSYPKQWNTQVDRENPEVLLGAKLDTELGVYGIETFKSSSRDQIYMKVPPVINVYVQFKPCNSIYVSNTLIKVPKGGVSTKELKVYFDRCFPVDHVTLIASVGDNKFSIINGNQTLVNQGDFTKYMIQYEIKSLAGSAGEQASINWQYDGNIGQYFERPPSVQLQIEDYSEDNDPPEAKIGFSQYSQTDEQLSFSIQCDQDGLAFYTLYIQDENYQSDASKILEVLEDGYHELIEAKQFDSRYQAYGSKYVQKDVGLPVIVKNIKMSSAYTIDLYCRNQNEQVGSVNQMLNVYTKNNGGQNVKLRIQFKDKIDLKVQSEIACSMQELLSINSQYIMSENGIKCANIQPVDLEEQAYNFDEKSTLDFFFLRNYEKGEDKNFEKIQMLRVNWQDFALQLQKSVKDHIQRDIEILDIEYSPVVTSDIIPEIVVEDIQTGYDYITPVLSLNNVDGYILVGIQKYLNTFKDISNTYTTSISSHCNELQLFYGKDGNNNDRVDTILRKVSQNDPAKFEFRGLDPESEYFIYYVAYPEEDVNPQGIQSEMKKMAMFTVPDNLIVVESYASIIGVQGLIVAIFSIVFIFI